MWLPGKRGKVILLSDSNKAEKVCFARFADWNEMDLLISDKKLSFWICKRFAKKGGQSPANLNEYLKRRINTYGHTYHHASPRTIG